MNVKICLEGKHLGREKEAMFCIVILLCCTVQMGRYILCVRNLFCDGLTSELLLPLNKMFCSISFCPFVHKNADHLGCNIQSRALPLIFFKITVFQMFRKIEWYSSAVLVPAHCSAFYNNSMGKVHTVAGNNTLAHGF